jgi:glycogen synthase
MRKKKIVMISPEYVKNFQVGGLGKVTELMLKGLREKEVRVKLVAPKSNIYGRLGDRTTEVNNRILGRRAAEICQRWQPEWLWVHDWGGVWAAEEVIKKWPKIKVVWTIHSPMTKAGRGYDSYGDESDTSGEEIDWGNDFFDFGALVRRGLGLARRVTTVSLSFGKKIGRGENFNKTEVVGINNGIDLADWQRDEEDFYLFKRKAKVKLQTLANLPRREVPVLVWVSRMASQKGLELLIEVLPKFLAKNEAQMVFLGEGEKKWKGKLKALEKKYGDKLVVWWKADFELPKVIMAGADYLVLPSREEPFGLVVAEAKRLGAVPIVNLVDGLKDQVKDEISGLGMKRYSQEELVVKLEEAVRRWNSEWIWRVRGRNVNQVEGYGGMVKSYLAVLDD